MGASRRRRRSRSRCRCGPSPSRASPVSDPRSSRPATVPAVFSYLRPLPDLVSWAKLAPLRHSGVVDWSRHNGWQVRAVKGRLGRLSVPPEGWQRRDNRNLRGVHHQGRRSERHRLGEVQRRLPDCRPYVGCPRPSCRYMMHPGVGTCSGHHGRRSAVVQRARLHDQRSGLHP